MSEQGRPAGQGWSVRNREPEGTPSGPGAALLGAPTTSAAVADEASAPEFSPFSAWTEEGLAVAAAAYRSAGHSEEVARKAALAYAHSAYPPEAYAIVAPPTLPPAPVRPRPTGAPATTTPAAVPEGFGKGAFIPGKGWVHGADVADIRWKPTGKRRGRPRLIPGGILARLAISATLGLVTFGAFGWHSWITNLLHGSHHISTPPAIAGAGLISTGPLSSTATSIIAGARAHSGVGDVIGGYYGTGPAQPPDYAVFAVKHSGSSLTGDDLTRLVGGISAGAYSSAITSSDRQGVTYRCGNYTETAGGVNVAGVACVWDDYDIIGMVISFKDANADRMLNTAQQVHDLVEK